MKEEYDDILNCPVVKVQKVISGKWNMVIIYFLSKGTLRFGELLRKLPNITVSSLTKQLRILEEYKIVHREIYKEIPPKVEYSLTPLGFKFTKVIDSLEEWLIEYEKSEKKE